MAVSPRALDAGPRPRRAAGLAAALGALGLAGALASAPGATGDQAVEIAVDGTTTHQTITGWEALFAGDATNVSGPVMADVLDLTATDLGITRLRLEVRAGAENSVDYWTLFQDGRIDYQTWRSHRYTTVNDNPDPAVTNPEGFHFSELDSTVEHGVLPLRERVAAAGGELYINLLYVAFTRQNGPGTAYIHDNPAEYAEFMTAAFAHLRDKYDLVPRGLEIILEPDNVPQWDGTTVGRAIVATAARLAADGFPAPDIIAPSSSRMDVALGQLDEVASVPGAMADLAEFSYHRYGGVSDEALAQVGNRATSLGLRTAMLEWWSPGNGYETLHADLKTGLNSAWQQGVIAGGPGAATALYQVDESDPTSPQVRLGPVTRYTRHYFASIRPGAVRIEASTADGAFDPLAFINPGRRYAVVIKAARWGEVSVTGLPPGTYAVGYTTAGETGAVTGRLLAPGEALAVGIPGPGVLAVAQALEDPARIFLPSLVVAGGAPSVSSGRPGASVESAPRDRRRR